VFNSDTRTLNIYTGTSWVPMIPANLNWSCGMPYTDIRDNRIYNTVLIGTQCWFRQSLNFGTRIDGASNQTNNGIIEKYCYNDDESYCDQYGGLYQWDELMNYTSSSNTNPSGRQGICPAGWHLPSDSEWGFLASYLGGAAVAGGLMKEGGLVHWQSPNTGATNYSGFTGLPAGIMAGGGVFTSIQTHASFWSTYESGAVPANSYVRLLIYNSTVATSGTITKTTGRSGRCLKD
jgi:uncharacterized protein (TIGR02145 family)